MKNILILITTISIIISCGVNKFIGPDPHESEIGYIYNLKIENNIITFQTKDSTFVDIKYKNRINPNDAFRGWTAGDASKTHAFFLPISDGSGIDYEMNLSVYYKHNSNIFQDTTLVFISTTCTNDFLKVHFINVQQGDAVLIQSPDGYNMVIDGGYGTRRNQSWQGGGVPLALNYIRSKQISHVDYIVETHRHEDHWGGLQDILSSEISTGQYISPSQKQGYNVGSRLTLGNDVRFDFFNIGLPSTVPLTGNSSRDENNKSVVLKTTYGDAEFLFTGDIDSLIQDWMISEDLDLSVDVLKIPHHGATSNGSSDQTFLSHTLNQFARIAILSFGFDNPYDHPRNLNRFHNFFTYGTNKAKQQPSGKHKYTDDCGTIVIYSDGIMIFVDKM